MWKLFGRTEKEIAEANRKNVELLVNQLQDWHIVREVNSLGYAAIVLPISVNDNSAWQRRLRIHDELNSITITFGEEARDYSLDYFSEHYIQVGIKVLKSKQETKMTREEAIVKLMVAKIPSDINGEYHILKVLEALGLIKFEELPKRPKFVNIEHCGGGSNSRFVTVAVSDMIDALRKLDIICINKAD